MKPGHLRTSFASAAVGFVLGALLVIVVSVQRHSKKDLVNKVGDNNSNKLRQVGLGSMVAKWVLLLEVRHLSHSRVVLVVKHQGVQAVLVSATQPVLLGVVVS